MPRLRRWKRRKCSLLIPALTRWAKVCRAYGAGRSYKEGHRESGNKAAALRKGAAVPACGRWAALRVERREGTALRLLPGMFDAVPLRKAERGKRQGAGLKPGPYKARRAELACGEIFQGAKASVEFGGRQAALAVESTQKIRGRTVALARVAFDTAGNQVAVGIASETSAWHDMVEALHVGGSAAEAVKASAAFAIVNGFAERPGFQEIRGFERRRRRLPGGSRAQCRAVFARANGADLLGQAHLHKVAGLAAFEHAQSSQLIEPAHCLARRSDGETQRAG